MKTTKIKKFTAMLLSVMLVLSMCITGIGASAAEAGDVTYIVAGVSDLCGLGETGYGWDAADTTNEMTANEDGTYSKVYTDVKVMNDYQLKITATDAAGATTWYGVDGGEDNFTFHVVEVCDVTVTFNPATLKTSVTGAGVEIPTSIDIDAIRTVGNGDGTWLNGVNWDPADDSNTMTEIAPNVYEITYTDIEEFDNYEFKFAANGSWAVNWGGTYAGSGVETNAEFNKGNITVDVPYEMADVTIRLDLTNFNFADKTGAKFTVTVVNTGDPIETDPIIPTEPVEVGYCLFGCIDGANYGCEEDYATIGDYVFEDGTLTATFAEASYVAVKTTDNANWYMTDGWAGIVNTVTLYNTSVLDTTADKLMVPAGEVTFTLVENEDGTLTLSYVADEVPTIPVQTDPVETVPTDPVEVGYCLFGYIDGANYGCEEDYATIGDYVFVDGTVTATFTETSYVAVKTTDNANWFMTDDWAGEVTEVVLYNSALLDETANKLMVPAGEVTFTLVENADGTLTLSYVAEELPTEPVTDPTEPETDPTEPETTAPIDNPAEKVSIFGDINVELAEEDTNIYTGSINLDAGTYTFKVNVFGTEYGYNGKYTDTIAGIPYSSSYKAATTFTATGGKYTFRFNTKNNMLTIKCKPYSELVELFGDINVELFKASGSVYSGSARLDAGEYTFRINEMGQQMCFGYKFTDSVVGIEYKDSWTGATTFVATGGIYTINYDTETNKLTFMHAPKGLGEVRIFGSLGLDLAVENGTSYYSATTSLAAGEYTFRIDELGTTMCFGGKFTDSIYEYEYKSEWKGASTFTATGGKYTFRYNAETNKLTISRAEIEQKVSIFGDINFDLATTDDVVYTGVVTLEAGTYTFRIDDFGTTYCFGGTFKNSIDKVYSSSYKAATIFEANGGDYKFTYNKNTHKLIVLSVG